MYQRPNQADLEPILNEVTDYPITGNELAAKAESVGANPQVMDFFESIGDTKFDSEAEVLSAAEQLSNPDAINEGETGGIGDTYTDDDLLV